MTIGHLLRTVHQDLRTIVELGDAVDGKQESESLFQGEGVFTFAEEAVGIMVLDEGHHTRGVGIEIVVDKRAIEAVQSLPPGIGLFMFGLVELIKEREVHDGLEVGVLLAILSLSAKQRYRRAR